MKTEGVIKKTSFKSFLDDDQNEGIDLEDGDQNNQNEGRENENQNRERFLLSFFRCYGKITVNVYYKQL